MTCTNGKRENIVNDDRRQVEGVQKKKKKKIPKRINRHTGEKTIYETPLNV